MQDPVVGPGGELLTLILAIIVCGGVYFGDKWSRRGEPKPKEKMRFK